MPLHPALQNVLAPDLRRLLEEADRAGDYQPVQDRMDALAATDAHRQPFAGEEGTKYYKPFVQTIVPKIIPALRAALPEGRCPEIEVLASEIDAKREELGIGRFGSPQDVLYGFTSERYADWGQTLEALGFTSACMTGQASAIVSMAHRFLSLKDEPDAEVEELEGAITRDFWSTSRAVFGKNAPGSELASILTRINEANPPFNLSAIDGNTAASIRDFLNERLENGELTQAYRFRAEQLCSLLNPICDIESQVTRRARTRVLFRASVQNPRVSQEQIGLKYVEEGKFLQKLLGGARVEHLQSNVKMVKNPLRENKCEVDSIYRVVGEKRIVLVEAKYKRRVSRSQLYQIYETYRLRLPLDWELDVVAVLLSKPSAEEQEHGVSTYIDLIKIAYDPSVYPRVTESLIAVQPGVQYRWKIRRQSQT